MTMSRKIIMEGTIVEINKNFDSKREEFNEKSFPIAKKIIEEHGGAIQVASEPGAGTTVTMEIPVER